MQKDVDTFWAWVCDRMEQLDIRSFRELERRASNAPGTISKRRNLARPPTVEMAEGMCSALRVTWEELWSHAGYATSTQFAQQLTADEREALDLLRRLPRDSVQHLIATIRAWVTTATPARVAELGIPYVAEPQPRTFSERLADSVARDLPTLHSDDQQIVRDLMDSLLDRCQNRERGQDVAVDANP